jgi:hypothetical protein
MMAFLSSVKQPTSQLAFLTRLPSIRSSRRKRKRLIFLLHVAVNRATASIAVATIATSIEATNATVMNANLTIAVEMIDAKILLNAMKRT